jgi:hypothetical protein
VMLLIFSIHVAREVSGHEKDEVGDVTYLKFFVLYIVHRVLESCNQEGYDGLNI